MNKIEIFYQFNKRQSDFIKSKKKLISRFKIITELF
jgi:hypothetical protein